MKHDVYERITQRIVADLEQGVRPWLKPWSAEHAAGRITRPLRVGGQPYQGINVLMLWGEAVAKGYAAPIWMTFRQALELGAHVRKGEHGSLVVYADRIRRTEVDEATGEEAEREIPFLKGYTVFNVEQIEGVPAHFYALAEPRLDPVQRIARAEEFFAATGAAIRHGGNMAYYSVASDHVQMPPFPAFRDAQSYYATLAHECTHWTRHPSRLAREFGRKRFGDEGYAMEELVAELGSAFLSADLGLTPEPREDHAAYIGSWLKVLKNDNARSSPPRAMRSAPPTTFTACSPRGGRRRKGRPFAAARGLSGPAPPFSFLIGISASNPRHRRQAAERLLRAGRAPRARSSGQALSFAPAPPLPARGRARAGNGLA